jgi:hypothetical protein
MNKEDAGAKLKCYLDNSFIGGLMLDNNNENIPNILTISGLRKAVWKKRSKGLEIR